MITRLDEIVDAAVARGKKKMIVAYGQDTHSIGATDMAIKAGLVDVTLVGDPEEIKKSCEAEGVDINQYTIIAESDDVKAVEIAVKAVHNGEYDVLMKGVVPTDKYMRGILNKEWGLLPAGTTLSHITVLQIPAYHKLLIVSDVAVLPLPSLEQKKQIAKYLVQTANTLGIEEPKVALLAPSEQLLPKVVSSVEAAALSEMGQNGELAKALFQGPLALDVAIDPESVKIKKLTGPVAGDADCLLFPNIESGNVFFKACTKFGGAELAAMVAGPTAPCVLTSRGDTALTKKYSIALACLAAR
ncbi:MAG: phosphate butyryltransferase [Alistipes sp.]|nr:phosphate butyryltransferase [Alistipes sp.]MBQ5618372.1 phosphate butyryltransferase [Alistipes sp.]MBQ5704135.1 phosphate butyryltransferase [Alistipes sp.]MBQ5922092.1 phosphate butyryltransferase [Alistipes sp.]MBQ6580964.1 phosphate butyryltransferase [Alistipes sp.]